MNDIVKDVPIIAILDDDPSTLRPCWTPSGARCERHHERNAGADGGGPCARRNGVSRGVRWLSVSDADDRKLRPGASVIDGQARACRSAGLFVKSVVVGL